MTAGRITGTAGRDSFAIDYTLTTPGFERPTGSMTVGGKQYPIIEMEKLYKTGDRVSDTIKRLTTQAFLSWPLGQFYDPDFKDGYLTCINIPVGPCMGIWGSGPGDYTGTSDGTYFGIKPGSSTHAKDVPTGKGQPTQMRVMKTNGTTGPQSYGQFAVMGTEQGHVYHGWTIYQPKGIVDVVDVLVAGWEGNSNIPPGETSGFSAIDGPSTYNHSFTRIDGDGRNTAGQRVGAGALGGQNLNGTVWTDCYAHDSVASQFGFFQSRNVTLNDCRSERNGTGSGNLSGQGFNFEQTDGCVLNRPVIVLDRANGNTGAHISHSNYGGTSAFAPGRLTINNPTFNDVYGDGKLHAQSWSPYAAGNTGTPVVLDAAGAPLPYVFSH